MTVARMYVMHAAEGKDASLETALRGIMDFIRSLPGSAGVELLRDAGNERRFVFIEKWDSIEAHETASKTLPQERMAPVIANLDGPPDGAYLDYLQIA